MPQKKEESAITLDKDTVYGIAVVGLACLLVLSVFTQGFGVMKPAAPAASAGNQTPEKLSDAELKSKAEAYINQNLITPGYTAEITKLEPYDRYTTLATLSIKKDGTELDTTTIYLANDGGSLFIQAFRLNETAKTAGSTGNTGDGGNSGAKVAKPAAQAFVMAFCPYGLQFLKAYVPVMELLGDKADMEVNFVSYAMHGKSEIDGNNYIYCVQKEDKPKLPAYLRCAVENGDYAGCIATAGIDAGNISACVADVDARYNITAMFNDQSTWFNGRYPQYPVDAVLASQYGVQGSPTFVLNGNQADVGRNAEAIKQAICSTFIEPPAECNTTLRSEDESAGTGPMGSGASSGGTANCGG